MRRPTCAWGRTSGAARAGSRHGVCVCVWHARGSPCVRARACDEGERAIAQPVGSAAAALLVGSITSHLAGRGHMDNQELARPANAAFVGRPPHRCGVADGERASVWGERHCWPLCVSRALERRPPAGGRAQVRQKGPLRERGPMRARAQCSSFAGRGAAIGAARSPGCVGICRRRSPAERRRG